MADKTDAAATRIEITGGVVFLKDFIDRKTAKAFRQRSYGDSVGGTDGKVNLKLVNFEEARDELVLAMIEKVEIGGKPVAPIGESFIDTLRTEDFEKLADACQKMLAKDEEKKS